MSVGVRGCYHGKGEGGVLPGGGGSHETSLELHGERLLVVEAAAMGRGRGVYYLEVAGAMSPALNFMASVCWSKRLLQGGLCLPGGGGSHESSLELYG